MSEPLRAVGRSEDRRLMSEQDTGLRHAVASRPAVASMAVVAVVLTTAAIAFLGWRFAGLPIALGAIVAPPDAVAANEVRDFNENLTFGEAGSSSAAKRWDDFE